MGWCKYRIFIAILIAASITAGGLLGFHKPNLKGCIMTYMYPMYIPVPLPSNATAGKYSLYLYHEGWKRIDYQLHLVKLSGVPVLFIPGNGGSYKQVRSIAAESDRAYVGGPQDAEYYQQSGFTPLEAGPMQDELQFSELLAKVRAEGQYANHLDWFAVDLEGEHSAMDGWILEEHSEYVVQAVHRILNRYKESLDTRSKHNGDKGEILPTNVILVGHSMGGFVARAAVVHPELRPGSVRTVVTLSSPHRSPPLEVQPSFGRFFSKVNDAWIQGFKSVQTSGGHWSKPPLSDVVVVSIAGGARDYQVRSRMASLDGIVPPTNGLTIGAAGMVNVFLSTDHQSILWCNQLVMQVSHTLLQLIDEKTGQQMTSPHARMAVFVSNLRSALPHTFDWLPSITSRIPVSLVKSASIEEGSGKLDKEHDVPKQGPFACPSRVPWEKEVPQNDFYSKSNIMTVLGMDGRRRVMDIKKLAKDGDWFVLATNLAPCTGVRVHLWPASAKPGGLSDFEEAVEVTTKMAEIPAGPIQHQTEPGGQTEQAAPRGILRLSPDDLRGFKFLSVSVAPRPSVSGRPPPAASMAVGHFFNPKEGRMHLSPVSLLSTIFRTQEVVLGEDHPLLWNLSIAVSAGTLPLNLTVKALSCGIQTTVLAKEDPAPEELLKICKARCFPPVALVWDPPFGLEVIPNLDSEIVVVDSAPAIWGSSYGSEHTTILLMVDPHCSYKASLEVSLPTAASRFLSVYGLQITGLAVAVVLFALMRQARAWELDLMVPSVVSCIEANLRIPSPLLLLAPGLSVVYYLLSIFGTETPPPLISFVGVSLVCYIFANGVVALLAVISSVIFEAASFIQVFFKLKFRALEDRPRARDSRSSNSNVKKVIKKLKSRPLLAMAAGITVLLVFVHSSIGLIVLLLVHAWNCQTALCRHRLQKTLKWSAKKEDRIEPQLGKTTTLGDELKTPAALTYGENHLETYRYRQGLLLLHLLSAVMLGPSLAAWVQRSGLQSALPSFLDSVLCFGIVLHGLYLSVSDANKSFVPLSHLFGPKVAEAGFSFIYGIAGLYCYCAGLGLAPYKAYYALALIGAVTAGLRFKDKQTRGLKADFSGMRRHSLTHKHI